MIWIRPTLCDDGLLNGVYFLDPYRLSCPNRKSGGTRFFPSGRAWSLSPFEFPYVLYRGYYGSIWYGAIGELIEEAREIAIVSKLLIGKCPSDSSRTFAD